MNYRTALVLGFVSIALLCGGCGTVENLREATPPKYNTGESWKTVYGGVQKDYSYISECRDVDFKNPHDPWLVILDLPFTLIGDTITLPYTVAYELGLLGVNSGSSPQDYRTDPGAMPTNIEQLPLQQLP